VLSNPTDGLRNELLRERVSLLPPINCPPPSQTASLPPFNAHTPFPAIPPNDLTSGLQCRTPHTMPRRREHAPPCTASRTRAWSPMPSAAPSPSETSARSTCVTSHPRFYTPHATLSPSAMSTRPILHGISPSRLISNLRNMWPCSHLHTVCACTH
jgi:hypothetical protein